MKRLAPIAALAASSLALQEAHAQSAGTPIIVPSQSSVYNQTSVNLPTPPSVHGQDIVRGSGGVSCQSAVASSGPYLDVGVIGSEDVYERSTAALYGRVVMPLGRRPDRVDCTRLYELEITRMRMELELLRAGATSTALQPVPLQARRAPPAAPAAPLPEPPEGLRVEAATAPRFQPPPLAPPPPPSLRPGCPDEAEPAFAQLEEPRRRGLR